VMVSSKSSMNFGMGAMKNCDYIPTVRAGSLAILYNLLNSKWL